MSKFKSAKLYSFLTDEPVDHIEKITDELVVASTYYYNKEDCKRYGRLYLIGIQDKKLTEVNRSDLWPYGVLETKLLPLGYRNNDDIYNYHYLCASMCSDLTIRIIEISKTGSIKIVNELSLAVEYESIDPNIIGVGLAVYGGLDKEDDNVIKIGGTRSDGKVSVFTMKYEKKEKKPVLTEIDKVQFIAHKYMEIWCLEFFDNEDALFSMATGGDDCRAKYWDESGILHFDNKSDNKAGVTVIRNTPCNDTCFLTASYDGYLRVYERNDPRYPVYEWNLRELLSSINIEVDEEPCAWRVEICTDIPFAVDLACCYSGLALRMDYLTGDILNVFPREKTSSLNAEPSINDNKQIDVVDSTNTTATAPPVAHLIYGVCSLEGGKKVLTCSFYEKLIEFWEAEVVDETEVDRQNRLYQSGLIIENATNN